MSSEEIKQLQQQIIAVDAEKRKCDALVEELNLLLATKPVKTVSLTFTDNTQRFFDVEQFPENGQRMLQYLIAHYSKRSMDLIKQAKELMNQQNG